MNCGKIANAHCLCLRGNYIGVLISDFEGQKNSAHFNGYFQIFVTQIQLTY